MTQPLLFTDLGQRVPNTFCIYEPRCKGVQVELGPARDLGGCVNQSATCCKCGRRVGQFSTRKDLAKS